MVVFPAAAALISLICAMTIARDAVRRPRPDKLAWVAAFAVFAIAAGTEVLGSLTEWTPTLARIYYLTGAVLIVGYLAVGELYLLAGKKIAPYAPGTTLLITAVAATIVFNASVDEARLADDGWEAIARGPALKTIAISLNALGTLVVVGGALYSAWKFWRLRIQQHRMIGCVLIAAGTLTAASGGTLTRLGHDEYLYIGISLGVALIFAGYLETRRPDVTSSVTSTTSSHPITSANGIQRPENAPVLKPNGHHRPAKAPVPANTASDPAIAFIERQLLPLNDDALAAECRIWSVPRREATVFDRDDARQVWAFRLHLSPEGQAVFDTHTVPAKLQLTELYHQVLIETPTQQHAIVR